MTIILLVFFVAALILCIFLMQKIRKLSSHINQLENAILGNRTGKKVPYESLALLNSLRRIASQWTKATENPALFVIKPDFIELMDNYISKNLRSIPEMNYNDNSFPMERRPQYKSLYTINSVTIFIESDNPGQRLISFYCASKEQADSISKLLTLKGIDARATIQTSVKPE